VATAAHCTQVSPREELKEKQMSVERRYPVRELTAIIVSGVVIIASLCYWVAQVIGVIEMLRLAYG
jgi:hypothetical protein